MRLFNSKLLPILLDSEVPAWVKKDYQGFISLIDNPQKEFPCVFAKYSFVHSSTYFTYINSYETNKPNEFIEALRKFLTLYSNSGKFPVLVVLMDTIEKTLAEHEAIFWKLINYLIKIDSCPWPSLATKNPMDAGWRLYFNGEAIFINGHSNAYKNRQSRKSSSEMLLVIQSYKNLDQLHLNHSNALERIRDNIKIYDGMPISVVFGKDFNDNNIHDWKQFWLTDIDNEKFNDKACPIVPKS